MGLAQEEPLSLTEDEGVEDYAALSPDGHSVAYAASEVGDVFGGNWDVWLLDLSTGDRRNLTADHDGDDRFPSFSPGGHQIAFWSDRDRGGYFTMALDTGEIRRISTSSSFASGPAAWSPDGTTLSVIVRDDTGVFLETVAVASANTARRQRPLEGKSTRRFDLAISSDGRLFAYVDGSSLTAHVTQLFVLDASTGKNVAVTNGWTSDWSPSWSPDGRRLYWVSNRGGRKDVWFQPMDEGQPAGDPVVVTHDVGIRRAKVSKDGRWLVYSKGQTLANVFRVPIFSDRVARWDDAEPVTEGEAYIEFISLSPDGKSLVTTSDESGNPDLWVLDLATKRHMRLTDDPTPDWGPAFSPDGERVGFYAYRSGNRDLWVLPAVGGTAVRLTDHPAADMYPTWSPDGSRIAFYSVRSGNRDLWVMPSEGGEARQLTNHPGDDLFPHWSPNGDWIAFYSERDGMGRIWAVTPDGRQTKPLTSGPGRFPRFSGDGSKLFFTGWDERLGNLYQLDLESGTERPLTDLSGRPGNLGSYVLATDDEFLYFTWERNIGDLYRMSIP